jgi:oligopeptidase B
MFYRKLSLFAAVALLLASCGETTKTEEKVMPQPPVAKKVPEKMTIHGHTRVDNYYWMKLTDEQKEAGSKDSADAQTADVLEYLVAENDYREEVMKDLAPFQDSLFNEIVGRIKQTDMSVPTKVRGYWYYSRYEEGKEYPFYCRRKDSMENEEEIMLNGPEMAEGHSYFAIGGNSVSPDNSMTAYGVDTVSRRVYTVYVKNLFTGEHLEDKIEGTTGGATWAEDNKTLFYSKKDPVTLRSYQIWKHKLGTPQSEDELVYQEDDETFNCYVYKTKSKKYIVIGSSQTMSTEYQVVDAMNPDQEFKMIQPRERGLEYGIDHYEDHFYIVTNYEAKNFRLMKTPVDKTEKENWQEVIAHREDVLLEGIDIFKDYLVVEERKNGLSQIRIKPWEGNEYYMEFQDPAYLAYTSGNPEFDTKILRYGYTSLTTPSSTYDFNMETKERTLLKQQEVIGDFSPENYESERLYATAGDGTKVPISLVYRKGVKRDGKNPLLLYGYGSYGASMDPYFSSVRLSLLDRGFVYAIAHIRGGQEMGRSWYEDGKLLNKKNTFTDFIDCADFLIEEKLTSKDHLYAMGGSAGGLLMGAVVNMRPDLWNGVVAAVPFVDVVTTMLDESIPLTTGEFDEWGNPKDSTYYEYILSYSPYDQVKAQNYPNMLVTTGYWDSQVQYWEPAKWVAKLRELKTDDNMLLMYCNMETGHGGASGRFERLRETAMEYAFFLDLEGINE